MRLKFQKVPALLLSAAMALTPATGVWAEQPATEATETEKTEKVFVWDEEVSPKQPWVYDEINHTATAYYRLVSADGYVPDDPTTYLEYSGPAKLEQLPADCDTPARDVFTFVASFEANGKTQTREMTRSYDTAPALGHDFDANDDGVVDEKDYYYRSVIEATCQTAGTGEAYLKCHRKADCKGEEVKETFTIDKLPHLVGEKEDQPSNLLNFVGYVNCYNVKEETTEYETKDGTYSIIKDADGKYEGLNDPSRPTQKNALIPYSFELLYECSMCGDTFVLSGTGETVETEGPEEINPDSIKNLYYYDSSATDTTPAVLVKYPTDVAYAVANNGNVSGTDATAIGQKEQGYLIDCTKEGSYQVVTYKMKDGKYITENGKRVVARTVKTVTVTAGHHMGPESFAVDAKGEMKVYLCDTSYVKPDENGKITGVVPTTCQDGWYVTHAECENPYHAYMDKKNNKPYVEEVKITVKGDARLHQYQPEKKVLDTQNCFNAGKQTYEKTCILCGDVATRVVDNSTTIYKTPKHVYGAPEKVEWVVEPTCKTPGKYLAYRYCVNTWQKEDGTEYVCHEAHEPETIVVEPLNHPASTEKLVWSGTLVVDGYWTKLKAGDTYTYDKNNWHLANAEIATVCDLCGEESAKRQNVTIKVVSVENETEASCAPGTIVLEATYTINGGKEQKEQHSFNYYSSIEAYQGKTNHVWSVTTTTTVKPTCTEPGATVTKRTCKLCGTVEEVSTNVVPATGHVAGETKVENGNLVTYCKVCGEPYLTVPVEDPVADFVDRMYDTVLNRLPDAQAAYWAQTLKDGSQTGAGIAVAFFTSDEYKGRNKTDSEYLNDLYAALMGRNADAAGKTYWQGILNMGYSRNYVLEKFIGSREFKGICEEYGIKAGAYTSTEAVDVKLKNVTGFVTRLYETTVGRTPDPSGLDYWIRGLVNGKVTGTEAVVHFCNSAEFQSKNLSDTEFVTLLYNAVMGRKADADGLNYWVGQLAKGATRTSVVESFAKSPEFAKICASYGITR